MKIRLLVTTVLVLSACFIAEGSMTEGLKIYLPREVTIKNDVLLLGDVTIMSGSKELIAKAAKIALGKLSLAGQRITVDRRTILSLLASRRIDTSSVSFSGSQGITVGRKELLITGTDIARKASLFLNDRPTDPSIAEYKIVKSPKNIVLAGQSGEITLAAKQGTKNTVTQKSITVDVLLDGIRTGSAEVVFKPTYNSRRAVAAKPIAAGEMLNTENTRIETIKTSYPEPKNWKLPFGLIAKKSIRAKELIKNSALMVKKPEILIKRNNLVIIKIETECLSITLTGQALGQGSFGELIKVKNIDSNRIIVCRINHDGTVSPAL
jgi:flagella basal body P-ring formation protein FlgA